MGCGGSAQKQVTDAEVSSTSKPEEVTWATKSATPAKQPNLPAVSSLGTEEHQASSRRANQKKPAPAVWLEDADDDEIEIVHEARVKEKPQAMGNSQEAPQEAEERLPQRPVAQPLPKQQQEEAAKLAEMRKKFENKNNRVAQGEPEPTMQTKGDAALGGPMVGFSLTTAQPQQHKEDPALEAFLPGGVIDLEDEEVFMVAQKANHMTKNRHDDDRDTRGMGRSGAVDASDEELMDEILQDVDIT